MPVLAQRKSGAQEPPSTCLKRLACRTVDAQSPPIRSIRDRQQSDVDCACLGTRHRHDRVLVGDRFGAWQLMSWARLFRRVFHVDMPHSCPRRDAGEFKTIAPLVRASSSSSRGATRPARAARPLRIKGLRTDAQCELFSRQVPGVAAGLRREPRRTRWCQTGWSRQPVSNGRRAFRRSVRLRPLRPPCAPCVPRDARRWRSAWRSRSRPC